MLRKLLNRPNFKEIKGIKTSTTYELQGIIESVYSLVVSHILQGENFGLFLLVLWRKLKMMVLHQIKQSLFVISMSSTLS